MTRDERPAGTIQGGWIYVPTPAAAPGWYRITQATHVGGWSEFTCGRPAVFVTPSRMEHRWSAHRPAEG